MASTTPNSGPTGSTTTFRFLDLESELQLMIFHYLCSGSEKERKERKSTRTNFLLTNKSVYGLFAPWFYRNAVFTFHSLEPFINTTLHDATPLCRQNLRYLRLKASRRLLVDGDKPSILAKCSALLALSCQLPTLSSIKRIELEFGICHGGIAETPEGTAFQAFFKDREDFLTNSSCWWRHVIRFTSRFIPILEDKIGREFSNPVNTRHHITVTFKMEDGERKLLRVPQPDTTSKDEAQSVMVPKTWGKVTYHHLVTTLTRK